MNHEKAVRQQRLRRMQRVRRTLRGTSQRPRLSVFRSHKNIYCQVIDDQKGRTLLAANTLEPELRREMAKKGGKEGASAVGKAIAQRALEAGITQVCFDRGPYKYHGRLAALADAAREAGLSL